MCVSLSKISLYSNWFLKTLYNLINNIWNSKLHFFGSYFSKNIFYMSFSNFFYYFSQKLLFFTKNHHFHHSYWGKPLVGRQETLSELKNGQIISVAIFLRFTNFWSILTRLFMLSADIKKCFFVLTELFYFIIFCIVEVKKVKMSSSMKQYAVDCATLAHIRYSSKSDIAVYIKNEFNDRYGRYWNCVVGEQFGYYIYHKPNHYIYFKLDQYYVVLFKSP